MKDYRLSEIVAHCKEMHDRYGEKACDNCEGARFCENQFANTPQYWVDEHEIEPRDMIELPCKLITDFGDGTKMFQIVWRGAHSKLIVTRDFDNEHEAESDEFLAELKGAKR